MGHEEAHITAKIILPGHAFGQRRGFQQSVLRVIKLGIIRRRFLIDAPHVGNVFGLTANFDTRVGGEFTWLQNRINCPNGEECNNYRRDQPTSPQSSLPVLDQHWRQASTRIILSPLRIKNYRSR